MVSMALRKTIDDGGPGTLCGERHSCGLTCHLCTALPQWAWICWCVLSTLFGKDIPPLSLLGVSKHSHLRNRSMLCYDQAFLLDVGTKINLADYSENSGQ